jgi:alkylated DNA repair dioxygenase AlkB
MFGDIGLKFIENFINENEEKSILENIAKFRSDNPKLIASYGSFNHDSIYFGERYKKDSTTIPDWISSLFPKLIESNLLIENPFGVAINQYKKGQKIGAHIDKPISGPIVTILSLRSSASMVFKRNGNKDLSIDLTPRSIIQIRDEIRNEWTHEILPVQETRTSIIFRSKC